MAHLFRAYKVDGAKIPTYFIESTAPNNVEDPLTPPLVLRPLTLIDPNLAIEEISLRLSGAERPNLVVMVHGFNNPQLDVLRLYATASEAIEHDPAISSRADLVCVGYRWPSEKMGTPWPSCRAALPTFPTWLGRLGLSLLVLGIIVTLIGPAWHLLTWIDPALHALIPLTTSSWIGCVLSAFGHALAIVGVIAAGLIGCAILLRIIVYFRDTYRATNYGGPDLIEIVRQIDQKIIEHDTKRKGEIVEATTRRDASRVELSFIGHSMGGYVVTNAIRALSDLFAFDAMRPNINTGVVNEEAPVSRISSKIGHAFQLMRFVLASPDIPAEALLSNRANFLASSLRRFREAYLFSNEGDEVLRQISTMANYFSFPTASWKFGFRLGNVEILSRGYGVVQVPRDMILETLRIGYYTLRQIYDLLQRQRGLGNETLQDRLPETFSYFDCTDYTDIDDKGVTRPLLTFALKLKQTDATARMSWRQHLSLLWAYCLYQKPNVHGGYFEGVLSQQLIYRLACLGYQETFNAFGGLPALSAECERKQIRVLLSPGI
ncbi:MAG: hypothetical protein ABSE22_16565 [Xanthobacteraceae bacterium]|jgi:energy-converting hydrogenase Eha subunit E